MKVLIVEGYVAMLAIGKTWSSYYGALSRLEHQQWKNEWPVLWPIEKTNQVKALSRLLLAVRWKLAIYGHVEHALLPARSNPSSVRL